jgi:CheY-like chemotaxis protein
VSHELRTPLNAVLGWSQVLRRAPADAEQTRRAILAIERNAQAQVRLVEDLLDTSRVISGKIRLELSTVDVPKLIAGAVESFGPVARAAGLELSVSVADDAGAIRADGARLQQVIGNLLSNSVKFTQAGGQIDVRVSRTASSLGIRVSDTGAGITSEFLPHVFDRFRQADSTTTRAHGGLGIGLAIVRHLVELHGGTIAAASGGAGQGSTFTIVLPAAEAPQGEERRSAQQLSQPASRIIGARVLAVDDSSDALDLIRTVLTAAGAVVSTASSVEQARHRMESERPDVLLADIGMPGQDGYALIRFVRAEEANSGATRLPAVALTAYARDEDRVRSLAAGYDLHLNKPIDPAALVEALKTLLDGSAACSTGKVVT